MTRPEWFISYLCLVAACLGCTQEKGATRRPSVQRDERPDSGADSGSADASTTCGPAESTADGWPCNCSTDCRAGAYCWTEAESGWPGGECMRLCSDSQPCGPNAACRIVDSEEGVCAPTCKETADCPPGRVCFLDECLELCFTDGDCQGAECNEYTNSCAPQVITGQLGFQAACLRDEDCKSGLCGDSSKRCLTQCLVSPNTCPDGGICAIDITSRELGWCYPPCQDGKCDDPTLTCRVVNSSSNVTACVPKGGDECSHPTDPFTYGKACSCKMDCAPDATCTAEAGSGFPFGLCRRSCDPRADDCAKGTYCYDFGGDVGGVCWPGCKAEADCRTGWACWEGQSCEPLCQADDECSGGTCDLYRASCQPPASQGLGTGQACVQDADCKSSLCSPAGCTSNCRISAQACPDGGLCADTNGNDDIGLCYVPCLNDEACTVAGTTCVETQVPEGASKHCE